jgi:hypothetical protein
MGNSHTKGFTERPSGPSGPNRSHVRPIPPKGSHVKYRLKGHKAGNMHKCYGRKIHKQMSDMASKAEEV